MNTIEAFNELTSRRAWYKNLGYSESFASSLKNRGKSGSLSVEKMEEVLLKAGYRIVQEKKWSK